MTHNTKNLLSLSSFYFTFFAGLGIILPFFPLYCKHLGFRAFEIALLSAIIPLSKVIFPPLWALLADRYHIRRGLTVFTSFSSVVVFLALFYVDTFILMAFFLFIYSFFRGPGLPFVEATTLEEAAHNRLQYGRIRLWGSIGFIVTSFGLGKLIDITSTRIVIYAIFIVTFLNALSTLTIPESQKRISQHIEGFKKVLFKKEIFLFFFSCMLMQASHGTYYGFFTIHLETVGYAKAFIGFLWAVGVISEVIILFFAQRLIAFTGILSAFSLSFICALVRWGICALTTSSALLLCAQVFHAFTFGVFHVSAIQYTYEQFPGKMRALGQTLYSGFTFGAGSIMGLIVNGLLYEKLGPYLLFAISSSIAFTAFIVSLVLMKKSSHGKSI
jgi:PPP family 3-phenylpropionic acid transporter